MNAPLTTQEWELLSTYLDGQLTEKEKGQVQEMLSRRPELGEGLDELRRIRTTLRAAPRRRAPRNFTLTPAMVQKPRRRFTWGWAPSFGFASALATILLVLSFFFRPAPAYQTLLSAAPAAAPAPLAAQEKAAQTDGATANPPVIIWEDATGRGSGPASVGGGYGPAPAQSQPSPTLAANAALAAPTATAADQAAQSTTAPVEPSATPAPKLAAPQVAQPASGSIGAAQDSNPILGIAPAEEQGKEIVQSARNSAETYGVNDVEPKPGVDWTIVQVGLAGAALAFAVVGLVLWRRSRL